MPRESLLGKKREEVLPADVATAHRDNDLRVMADMEPLIIEEENCEPDGIHTYLSVKFPLLDPRGQLLGVGGISTDITERKEAEELLKKFYKELEISVQDRTKELETKITEIERMNKLFIDREFRIKELKERVKELEGKVSP